MNMQETYFSHLQLWSAAAAVVVFLLHTWTTEYPAPGEDESVAIHNWLWCTVSKHPSFHMKWRHKLEKWKWKFCNSISHHLCTDGASRRMCSNIYLIAKELSNLIIQSFCIWKIMFYCRNLLQNKNRLCHFCQVSQSYVSGWGKGSQISPTFQYDLF